MRRLLPWLLTATASLPLSAEAAAPAETAPNESEKAPASDPPGTGEGAPRSESAKASTAEELQAGIDEAVRAWSSGEWERVQELLEPLVSDAELAQQPLLWEMAHRYLADAILFDEQFALEERERRAAELIDAVLERNRDWTPPANTHGPSFYRIADEVRRAREAASAADCEAERLACRADIYELRVDHRKLTSEHRALEREYDEDLVPVVRTAARNRAVALIPGGVGHFYDRRWALGAAFLGSELGFGFTALGLALDRRSRCERTSGLARGSLDCQLSGGRLTESDILLRRNLEQAFAIAFFGTLIVDVVLAQVLFEPYRIEGVDRVPRREIESQLPDEDDSAGAAPKRRSRKKPPPPSARLRPSSAVLPGGGAMGLRLDF